MKLNTLSV